MVTSRSRFDRLITPHADALWGLARRLSGDDATADDLLQQALVTAFLRLETLRDPAAARGWAGRIVVRAWLDSRRGPPPPAPLPEEAAVAGEGPEDRVMARQTGDRVLLALDVLPEHHRAAVWLVDGEGYTFAEAAAALGVAPGTVASRVARGRAALRTQLSDLSSRRTR